MQTADQTWLVDESDVWSDEDLEDLTRYTLAYAAQSFVGIAVSA